MTTRLLKDDLDLFYDVADTFEYALEGEAWGDRWFVGTDRSVQVGDTFFLLYQSYSDTALLARGRVVAAEDDDQVQKQGGAYADLSPAYCHDYFELAPTEEGEILWVRYEIDSAVEIEHLLKLAWLTEQPECAGCGDKLLALRSGDAIPEELVPGLMFHWDRHVAQLEPQGLAVRRG